jgi:hypothetical protein
MEVQTLRSMVLQQGGGFAKYLADYLTKNPNVLSDYEAKAVDLSIAALEDQKAEIQTRIDSLAATKVIQPEPAPVEIIPEEKP